MPIKGLTDVRRLPRIGKIHLGIKKKSAKGIEYPSATDYFVCPDEVKKIYGEQPKRLDIIIPVEDDEIWASQFYRQYSRSRGLVCKGDGTTCRRMIDVKTGSVADRDTQTVDWREGLSCEGQDCPDYKAKKCQEVMNLQFLLPTVPSLGVWQIDTGSIHSIRNINDCATLIRGICGKINWIPLVLTLEPTEVVNPDDGKKKTVYCMHLKTDFGLKEIVDAANKPRQALLISPPADDEAPDDRKLSMGNSEKAEEYEGQVEEDISDLFPVDVEPGVINEPLILAEPKTQKRDFGWVKETLKIVGRTEKAAKESLRAMGLTFGDSLSLQSIFNGASEEIQKKFTDKLGELREAAGK